MNTLDKFTVETFQGLYEHQLPATTGEWGSNTKTFYIVPKASMTTLTIKLWSKEASSARIHSIPPNFKPASKDFLHLINTVPYRTPRPVTDIMCNCTNLNKAQYNAVLQMNVIHTHETTESMSITMGLIEHFIISVTNHGESCSAISLLFDVEEDRKIMETGGRIDFKRE